MTGVAVRIRNRPPCASTVPAQHRSRPAGPDLHPGADRALRRARRNERKRLRRLARLAQAGKWREVKREMRRHFTSESARLVAAREVNRKLKGRRKLSPQQVADLANGACAWEASNDTVIARERDKGDGRTRTTYDFSPRDRVLQKLVERGLRACAQLHPGQTMMQGGRAKVYQGVTAALDEGYKWVVIVDIKECFPSLRVDRSDLPLPRRVADNVLALGARQVLLKKSGKWRSIANHRNESGKKKKKAGKRHPNLRRNQTHPTPRTGDVMVDFSGMVSLMARRGLSQGSATSPIAAEMLLAPVLYELPDSAPVLTGADDIITFAWTRREARILLNTLHGALARHPSGPLQARIAKIKRAADGFAFSGWQFRTRRGRLTVRPSHRAWTKFGRELGRRIESGDDEERLMNYARNWAAQFAPWKWHEMFMRMAVRNAERRVRRRL